MMRLVTDDYTDHETVPLKPVPRSRSWPIEVDMILSAMEVARAETSEAADRRKSPRASRRVRAELQLFASNPLQPPIELFTRDLSTTGMGFITRERLPLGYSGLVAIHLSDEQTITAQCNVYRCREAINGWYEGALTFNVEQPGLA